MFHRLAIALLFSGLSVNVAALSNEPMQPNPTTWYNAEKPEGTEKRIRRQAVEREEPPKKRIRRNVSDREEATVKKRRRQDSENR